MQIGLVGLPNVGKSTLFNALTRSKALVENYPFATIEPNLGRVPLADEYLRSLQSVFGAAKAIPAFINFIDIAGLVAGAHRGEGLGNQFLSHIRNVEVIVHVLRSFPAESVAHVEGKIDPLADLRTVELELILADMVTLEKRSDKARSMCQTGEKKYFQELALYERLQEFMDREQPVRFFAASAPEKEILDSMHLLTAKPVLYVLNGPQNAENFVLETKIKADDKRAVKAMIIDAQLEADLLELPEEDSSKFLQELGLEPALERLVSEAYSLLDLIRFYTGNEKEVRAWNLPQGERLITAAGKVHTDIAQGFIKGEVVPAGRLVEAGSWSKAKEKGLIRTEGRDYLVARDDVIYIHFR